MKIDAGGYASTVDEAATAAKDAEQAGFDGAWAVETQIDPFLACAVAAERTEQVNLGTSIAVAFSRNPMTVAVSANDVQSLSGGRFSLGLGSQIKPHITRRFSMPWSKPAARMREFILAIRAIWDCWENDTKLNFQGEFYQHTLMTPFFNPGPNPYGRPKIYLAGVGELMTEVAGEVADGFLVHGFTTERYLHEVTLPALRRGREKVGKTLEGFDISGPLFIAGSDNEAERDGWATAFKNQIAFYGSTPAYRKVLEMHGWEELGDKLNAMSKRGEWHEMAEVIDDEVLHTFAVLGDVEYAASELNRRWGDVLTRVTLASTTQFDPNKLRSSLR
jgi:probable F420-dependent oxidoreductase